LATIITAYKQFGTIIKINLRENRFTRAMTDTRNKNFVELFRQIYIHPGLKSLIELNNMLEEKKTIHRTLNKFVEDDIEYIDKFIFEYENIATAPQSEPFPVNYPSSEKDWEVYILKLYRMGIIKKENSRIIVDSEFISDLQKIIERLSKKKIP
jgi:hypothetical protein